MNEFRACLWVSRSDDLGKLGGKRGPGRGDLEPFLPRASFVSGPSLDNGVRREASSAMGPALSLAHPVCRAVCHNDILLQRIELFLWKVRSQQAHGQGWRVRQL